MIHRKWSRKQCAGGLECVINLRLLPQNLNIQLLVVLGIWGIGDPPLIYRNANMIYPFEDVRCIDQMHILNRALQNRRVNYPIQYSP
jgi:hypothetical protein